VLLILLVCCNNYYGFVIDKLPYGYHDWAQGDRLAIAINFYDNGMDFFHPATQNITSTRGIVGVEFPIQAYTAAGIAHLLGRNSISTVFRVLDILIALTGLYFLFRAVFRATGDFVFSLFAPLFIFCSPVFIYYSGNYLPDPAAASIAFIALYCLLESIRRGSHKMQLAAIVLAALAVLIKASTASYFGGVVCYCLYHAGYVAKNRKQLLYVLLCSLAASILIAGNIAYVRYLNTTYKSSLFLSTTLPFDNWGEFGLFIDKYYKDFMVHEYISIVQYPVYFLLIGFGVQLVVSRKIPGIYGYLFLVFLFPALAIFWLFGKQYLYHDYYFISTFLPLVAYCLVVALIVMQKELSASTGIQGLRVGMIAAMVMMFFFADFQNSRRVHLEKEFDMDYSFRWLEGGSKLMDELHIPANEHVVVADEAPPNLSLIYFDRKGYTMPREWNTDAFGLNWFMNDKGVRIAAINARRYKEIYAKDSLLLDSLFVTLANKDGKVVLQKKDSPAL
jgi:hypothetical protein